MKHITGHLRKMLTALKSPVEYKMVLGEQHVLLNSLLQKHIHIAYTGNIHCIQCGRKITKTFQQGYCFPCMQRLNECGNCAIFPERCLVETGKCPKDDWAHRQCYSSQIIYLANTSGLKVGITRESHVPTRWIDQGAIQAIPIYRAKNRYRAGVLEVALKQFVSDRTNWRMMLKNTMTRLDMLKERDNLLQTARTVLEPLLKEVNNVIIPVTDSEPISIEYPVLEYPKKISSLSLDKLPEIQGVLLGIKGQYLILDSGVLNIRKFGGYEIGLCVL